ncbi:MAG: hypothetical protein ACRDBL_09795 [Rhabdaerophilum sp.]
MRKPKYSLIRRVVFTALAAVLMAMAAKMAVAQPLSRVGVSVQIQGVNALAGHIRQRLPVHLQRELRETGIDGYPAGSRLMVVVNEVYLSHDGGMPFGRSRFGMSMPDSIGGAMQVQDARGRVLYERTMLVASPADSGGSGFSPYNEARRVEALMAAMAQWAVRYAQR